MKILHVCKKYPNALGGDAVVVSNLVKQQSKSGQTVSVLTSNCDEIENSENIYKFGLKDTPSNLDRITYKLLKITKPDIVHTHSIDMAFVISFAARRYNIPIVHTFHIVTFNDSKQKGIRDKVELSLLRYTKPYKITVLSPKDVKDFKIAGYHNVLFIPNGVDTNFWRPLKNIKKNSRFTYIAVGRLEEQKGFQYLIDAAAKLKIQGNNFQLLIVGQGSMKSKLIEQIHRLSLDHNVYLLGKKSPSELRKLYNQSQVFVLSSLWEGMPLTLLEAWSSGLLIISTNISSVIHLIPNNKYLISPTDSDQLATAMTNAFVDKSNPLPFNTDYDWRFINSKYLKLYKEIQ